MVFSDIERAVLAREVDAGVLIHEGRFTYEAKGLARVEDLGAFWERETGAPIPLGGILGRRRLGAELLRRVADAGHEVGAHGDWHLPMPIVPPHVVRHELLACARAIEAAGAPRPRFYRPPFGLMLPSQAAFARRLGFEPVLGDVYPEDPRRPGVAKIVARTMRRLREGSILILHDGSVWLPGDRSQTIRAVEIILGEAADKGLRAVTVGELLDGVEMTGSARARPAPERSQAAVPDAGV